MKCMVRVMLKASNGNIESEVEKEHKMEQVDNDGKSDIIEIDIAFSEVVKMKVATSSLLHCKLKK